MIEPMKGRVLVVDDDAAMCELLEHGLRRREFEVESSTSPRSALALLEAQDIDVLVTDLNMAEIDGFRLCQAATAARPGLPVIMITAFGDLETAIGAIRAGAYDFITKPFDLDAIAIAISRAVERRRMHEEVRQLRAQLERSVRFEELIGESAAMRRVFELLERTADADATLLVTGESGTGKEVVARSVHARSRRCDGPFVAINCAAVPESLLESELFGHARGAFTDAKVARQGLLHRASGGTLFLDEIGEMTIGMQVKLLRALQERVARPVGSFEEVPFDVRVIAATNRDIEVEVEEGRFREDLYYRLNVIHVELPPLRARGNDVLLLAQRMIDSSSAAREKGVTGVAPEAASLLLAYGWPGNVRELQNCVERAVVLTRFAQLAPEDLPRRVRESRQSQVLATSSAPAEFVSLEEVERRYILKVLDAVGGQKAAAARILGLDRRTLYRKLERWDVSG